MTVKYNQIMGMSSRTQDISGLFLDPDTERFSATVGTLELKYVKELK
nr:11201_t:CDS:2 [Entrophospora candida]